MQWEALLDQIRAAPGCEARIQVRPNRVHASNDITRIRKRHEATCPYEKWRFRVRELQDDSGVFGVFATYLGVMTESEYQIEQEAKAKRRADALSRAKRRAVKRKLQNQDLTLDEILQLRSPGQ